MGVPLLTAAVAYLIGSFPTAVLVARRWGHDPTAEGSGNPGASNVYRVAGRRAGALVFLGDIAKGALAAGVGYAVDGRVLGFVCGIAAVVGHTLPPWGRRGGKGVAASAGMLAVLFPLLGLAALVAWVTTVKLTGKASLASLMVALALPAGVALIGRPGWEVATVALLAGYVIARHTSNIARLLRGQERPLGREG